MLVSNYISPITHRIKPPLLQIAFKYNFSYLSSEDNNQSVFKFLIILSISVLTLGFKMVFKQIYIMDLLEYLLWYNIESRRK